MPLRLRLHADAPPRCAEAARAFRAWEAEHRPGAPRLPIFALTANVLDEHRAECAAAGMDGFVSKPLRACMLPELQQRARGYAEQLAAEDAAAEGAAALTLT